MFGSDRQQQSTYDAAGGLRDIRIFADLAPKELVLLGSECFWRKFSKGDIVLSAARDGAGGEVMFVVRGSVRLARPTSPNGRIAFSDIEAGDQFGEMSLFGASDSDLTAMAREDCVIAVMPEKVFVELLSREESVSRALLCQYAKLLRQREATTSAASEGVPGATGSQRIYSELLALGEPRAANGEVRAGLFIARLPRHRELADRLSTTEEVVAGAIAELVRLGIAAREYPGLFIGDETALRSLCERR
ncbi:MAG: Crp/Fnr family transcriptional regulator [Parvibaculum sp.]|uniref:Crp/Fnr family transcriptional regulator n=1 Tax=Parvibaculum sp. TaxID=2024848 RepID=UPI003C78CEE3